MLCPECKREIEQQVAELIGPSLNPIMFKCECGQNLMVRLDQEESIFRGMDVYTSERVDYNEEGRERESGEGTQSDSESSERTRTEEEQRDSESVGGSTTDSDTIWH